MSMTRRYGESPEKGWKRDSFIDKGLEARDCGLSTVHGGLEQGVGDGGRQK